MISDSVILGSLVGFGTIATFACLAYVYKSVSSFMPFLYANSRIAARSNYLISEKRQKELANLKSVKDLAAALQNTDYAEGLKKATDLRSFHSAIERTFINSVIDLKDLSPKSLNKIFDAYLMFWESKILKTIYRAKFSGAKGITPEIAEDLVFEVAGIGSTLLKRLVEAKTIADMNLAMSDSIYATIFAKEYSSIEEFEVSLDSFILKNFVKVVKETKIYEAVHIIKIFNTKFDIMNLLGVLKARVRNTGKERIKKLLIKNDSMLYSMIDELIAAESLRELVERSKGLPYYNALSEGLAAYNKDKSFIHFEKELYKYYKSFVVENELYHVQGSYVIFSYLTKKEIEQKNLLIISKGIEESFPAEEIRGLLV